MMMLKFVPMALLCGALVLGTSATAAADADTEVETYYAPDQALTLNPVDAVNGYLNLEYEHALATWVSLFGGVNVLVWPGVWTPPRDRTLAVGPEAGVRFYLLGDAPEGLWLGPLTGLAYVRVDRTGVEALGLYAGAMAGGTVLVWDVLALSAGVGFAYNDVVHRDLDEFAGFRGWTPRFRLAAGVAF